MWRPRSRSPSRRRRSTCTWRAPPWDTYVVSSDLTIENGVTLTIEEPMVVVTPSGYRVEGLDIEDAATLLRKLSS